MTFIPLTHRVFDALREQYPQIVNQQDGFMLLSGPVEFVAARVSRGGTVAYIETEYFGGAGHQGAIVWRDERVLMARRGKGDAINKALAMLGVRRAVGRDEFDTVGLGRHRHMDDWNYPDG